VAIDYLALGHLAKDLVPGGHRLGGTVAYAALTAKNLGYNPGLVTSFGDDLTLSVVADLDVIRVPAPFSTTYENLYGPQGRSQFTRAQAAPLPLDVIPPDWWRARLVHLAPLARELDPAIVPLISAPFIGLTPQGWLREWDAAGRITKCDWPQALDVLPRVSAAVLSLEDLRGDWATAERWAKVTRVLVITEGQEGCTVFVTGEGARQFAAPPAQELDPTGAGDIFAAAFFIHLYETEDPFAAAKFANHLAALSVTRPGLAGVPTVEEVALCRMRAI